MHIEHWLMRRLSMWAKVCTFCYELFTFHLVLVRHALFTLIRALLSELRTDSLVTVTVRFQPLPSAPILRKTVFKISASQKFETVVNFLRKKLDCKDTDSVFCYINNVFAPSLDEGIGGLYRVITPINILFCFRRLAECSQCFKNETDDQLWVQYSMTPFFG